MKRCEYEGKRFPDDQFEIDPLHGEVHKDTDPPHTISGKPIHDGPISNANVIHQIRDLAPRDDAHPIVFN